MITVQFTVRPGQGDADGSLSARHARVTPGMRKRLMRGPTEQWEATLDGGSGEMPTW